MFGAEYDLLVPGLGGEAAVAGAVTVRLQTVNTVVLADSLLVTKTCYFLVIFDELIIYLTVYN